VIHSIDVYIEGLHITAEDSNRIITIINF